MWAIYSMNFILCGNFSNGANGPVVDGESAWMPSNESNLTKSHNGCRTSQSLIGRLLTMFTQTKLPIKVHQQGVDSPPCANKKKSNVARLLPQIGSNSLFALMRVHSLSLLIKSLI